MTEANLGLEGGWYRDATGHARALSCAFFVLMLLLCIRPRYMSQSPLHLVFSQQVMKEGFSVGRLGMAGAIRTSFLFASYRGPASFRRVGLGEAALWFPAATLDLLECDSMACPRCYTEHWGRACVHIQYCQAAFQ